MRRVLLLLVLLVGCLSSADTVRNPPQEQPGFLKGPNVNFYPPYGCTEETPPGATISSPSTGPLGGLDVTITTSGITDASGVKEARFYYEYCPSLTPPTGCTGHRVLIGIDKDTPYTMLWTFPDCVEGPDNDDWTIWLVVEDVCGNTAQTAVQSLVLNGRGC